MLVFKFGGASVKDADAVRNVAEILKKHESDYILVIVSAMGKTTNNLEQLIHFASSKNRVEFNRSCDELKEFHMNIVSDLFPEKSVKLVEELEIYFKQLKASYDLYTNESLNEFYDRIVSYGELISTQIVGAFLNQSAIATDWVDASTVVVTDDVFRSATVDLGTTSAKITEDILPRFESSRIVVTQGFIGSSKDGRRTTLGREGSDYSGAIFSYCLNASSLTIWKDVQGMFNADPKIFPNAQKIDQVSYKEAIELSYYGASVIHPKTIQPLQNKNIPLYVKSFLEPNLSGTEIFKDAVNTLPCYIIKKEQVLVSLSSKDFSFIAERHLSEIFGKYDSLGMKINIMQNSAVNFSALFDAKNFDEKRVIDALSLQYAVRYNTDLELITIRQFNTEIIEELTANREILLEQKTRETVRLVVRKT